MSHAHGAGVVFSLVFTPLIIQLSVVRIILFILFSYLKHIIQYPPLVLIKQLYLLRIRAFYVQFMVSCLIGYIMGNVNVYSNLYNRRV